MRIASILKPFPFVISFGSLLFPLASYADGKTDSYSFLNISTSTHAYALGGSGAAIIDDDVTLADQNPALLGPEIESQLAVNYMRYLGDANFGGARFGHSAGEHSAWAAGIRYLNYGAFQGYEADGTKTDTFTPQDIVFEGTYSRDINSYFRGGINLKMVYSDYEQYSAFAVAADLGLNYYYDEYDLSLSLVLRNMGGQLKRFADSHSKMPFEIELAYMQGLGNSPFSLAITATDLTHWRLPYYNHDQQDATQRQAEKGTFASDFMRHLIFGLQYNPNEKFYVALGYNYRVRTDMGSYHRNFLSGWSAGAGFKVKSFGVGVAYAQPHASGSTLMLNLSMNFAELINR